MDVAVAASVIADVAVVASATEVVVAVVDLVTEVVVVRFCFVCAHFSCLGGFGDRGGFAGRGRGGFGDRGGRGGFGSDRGGFRGRGLFHLLF